MHLLLPTSYFLPPASYLLLPTSYFLLPTPATSYLLLPTSYFWQPGNLPAIENALFYHQLGNVAFLGYSGAYGLSDILPAMKEACAWLPAQQGVEWAVLLGHWDFGNYGATVDTAR